MRNRNTGNRISLATFSLLKPYLSFGWQSAADYIDIVWRRATASLFVFLYFLHFLSQTKYRIWMSCIATGAHVPSDHSPIQSGLRILIRELRVKNYSKSTKKKWRREENKKIRNASSHLCQGIYYSNDVEWVKVSPSREVWKEYDLRKHEKKKMKLNSHTRC
jgi:hypothetical protein